MNMNKLMNFVIASSDPKIISGGISLAQDLAIRLCAGTAAIAGAVLAFHGLRYMAAGDQEKPHIWKTMKGIFYMAVVIVTGSGTLAYILSYFQ